MKSSIFPWLFFIAVHSRFLYDNINVVSGHCLSDQRLLLLELNKSLIFDESSTTDMSNHWNDTSNCCRFQGVTCDEEGHVTGLNLTNNMIIGGLDNSSPLFDLQHLQKLDLSENSFNSAIPSRIGELTNLTHIYFSEAEFKGQIPREISNLRRLVVLDLSDDTDGDDFLKFENPNLSEIFRNFTELQELYLDGVNMSSSGEDWCQVLSSSLHNLRVLSLTSCSLSGPICSSLAKLHSLSELKLSANNLSSPVPEIFANFSNLTVLRLQDCQLNGTLPKSLGKLTRLVHLGLSHNKFMGPIPSSHWKGLLKLTDVNLKYNSLSGSIPSSLLSLPSLQLLTLSNNQFSGQLLEFPNASSSLLDFLDLSNNNLEGPIPISTFKLRNLNQLDLSSNKFNGTIHFINMIQGLPSLVGLGLSNNNLTVILSDKEEDSTFFSLHKFTSLNLGSCNLRKFPLILKNQTELTSLDLSDNQIRGEIPNWIWELGNGTLSNLNLSFNQLVRIQEPYSIKSLYNLVYLDLQYNQLIGTFPIPPSAYYINLSQNKFTSFPVDIGHHLDDLGFLSLSNNNLTGVIPQSLCNGSFLQVLDLSYNHLSGSIPTCIFNVSETLNVLKLRNNNFSGMIANEFYYGCNLRTLDLNGNGIEGRIPRSFAYCTSLEDLDLGNNNMVDTFPLFLNKLTLRVLILRSNNFHGRIECSKTNPNWKMLQIVDISHNNFDGELPTQCLMTWEAMRVDQSPNAQTNPDYLRYSISSFTYYNVRVMVTYKDLQLELVKILRIFTCIDFSSNNFTGQIPQEFGQLQSLYILNLSHNVLTYNLPSSLGNLNHLESLDLSWNQLNGTIPISFTKLNFLSILNLSYNQLVGKIPTGNQIQTFSQYSFIGNKGLCGSPLENCSNDENSPKMVTNVVPKTEIDWEVIFVVIGFVFGFGAIIVPLVFSKRWRKFYFKCVEDIGYKIIPFFILRKWWKWKARRQGKRQQRC